LFSENIVESLKNYISDDEVFGPKDASLIMDLDVVAALFDAHNKIYSELQKKPSIIIGRKGAGKTSFLKCSILDEEYQVLVELKTWEALAKIISSIEEMSTTVIFVESVAEIWDAVFWTAIIAKVSDLKIGNQESQNKIKKFLTGVGLVEEMSPDSVMTTIVEVLQSHGNGKPFGIVADLFDKLIYEDVSFNMAKETTINLMNNNLVKAVILMDSIEYYPLEIKSVSHAISGLLKCLGSFHTPGSPNEVRCCLPAELYHVLYDLSSHPLKDFQSHVTLHWHAGELLQVAASRLRLYFFLYDQRMYENIKHLKLEQREDCKDLFERVFPSNIINRIGGRESPIAYILRHTQLNPRHLIHILNNIFYQNKRLGNSPRKVSEDAIREGIFHVEESLCKEIYKAYKYVHSEAEKVFKKCLPHLPIKFSEGVLHKTFNHHGKKYFHDDFDEFKRMFVELGAIGRVIGDTDRYVIGLFEYTQPHQLVISSYETLCLHPIFTEIYNNRGKNPSENIKPVYPYGTDIEGDDHRDWQ